MAIQRYDLNTDMCSNAEMLITMGGDYVLHADHIAEVERLTKALKDFVAITEGNGAVKMAAIAALEGK